MLDPVFNSLPRFPRAASVWMSKYLAANCNALVAVLLTDLCILHVALEKQKGTFEAGSSPVSGILAGTGTFHSLSPASWYQSSSSLAPTLAEPLSGLFFRPPPIF